jgi:DNA-binding MarR family transcriptional regulator
MSSPNNVKFRSDQHKASIMLIKAAYEWQYHVESTLKNIGMTPEQFNVMRIIKGANKPNLCVKDIACRMVVKNSNVPRIIDRLELKGWIGRRKGVSDKRETEITIRPEGELMLDKASVAMQQLEDHFYPLTKDKACQLSELLEEFFLNLSNEIKK